MNRLRSMFVLLALVAALPQPTLAAEGLEGLEVLFITKSSGFQHSVIQRVDGKPSHAETVFGELAKQHGFRLETTKDASRISADGLREVDVVVFFTTGDLTVSRSGEGMFAGDGEKPMSLTGVQELLDWLRRGGGFVGVHSATDTFQERDGGVSPYVAMIGGQFRVHGAQFVGRILNAKPDHPVMSGVPEQFELHDEWYLFDHQFADASDGAFEVLARLEPDAARTKQPKLYDVAPYPVLWSRDFGEGRVVYNAMGHREDAWTRDEFQAILLNAVAWAAGRER